MGKSKKESNEASESAAAVAEAPGHDPLASALAVKEGRWADVFCGLYDVPLELIKSSSANPRTEFDATLLDGLSESFNTFGQVQAITLLRLPEADANGKLFVIEAGERRYRSKLAAKAATIRAEVKAVPDDEDAYVRRVIENVQRQNLSAMEEAVAFERVLKRFTGDKNKAAAALGVGLRVFEQTLQFAHDLIQPVMDALRQGRISKSHAALICRQKAKHQLEALKMCFEPRSIFNGATAENEEVLISEKELRGKLNARFRDDDDKLRQAALDLGVGSVDGPKDKNDIEREHQQQLESEADQILDRSWNNQDSAGGEQGSDAGNGGAPASPSPESKPAAPAKAVDDDEADEPKQTETEYEAQAKQRLERLGRAFDKLPVINEFRTGGLAMLAKMTCPPMPNAVAVERMFGAGLILVAGNRYEWKDGGGTIQQFIDHLADQGEDKKLYRLITVFMYLPSVNPSYSDADLKVLERNLPSAKTVPVKTAKKPFAAKKPKAEAPKKPAAKKPTKKAKK